MKKTQSIISILLAAILFYTAVPVAAYVPPAQADLTLKEGYAEDTDAYAIYPVPQHTEYGDGSFSLASNVNVVSEAGIDAPTSGFLDEVLRSYGRSSSASATVGSGSQILLGIYGSGGVVDSWAKSYITLSDPELFTQTDAYLLAAKDGVIAILGKDSSAVYYGVATLQMMFSSFGGNRFLDVQIEDYAGMKMRGFIEGFYGGWNYEGRESLMRFARDFKMNTYIYASKTDEYHKNDVLYPESEIAKIADLVQVGEETKVRYCWSVHISYFFNRLSGGTVGSDSYNKAFDENFDKLKAKFKQLYDVGVRKFAILNDDFGSGSHSEVVRLLNKLNEEFLVPNGCDNLTYCMQGYNRAWSSEAELTALRGLDETIDLFWTGDDVNSPITQETVDFVKEKTGHEAVFWLNYPVNEHAKSGIYLGDITHYARDAVSGLAGAVSNPCLYTEANKVGLFQLASLFWNNRNYLAQAEAIWEESFKYLQPEVYDAYLTIARNVSNCPGSGRVPAGFPESEYLAEAMDTVGAKIQKGQPVAGDANAVRLKDEFGHITSSIETFRSACTNETLKAELAPWLNSLRDVAAAGGAAMEAVFAMEKGDVDSAWKALAAAGKAMETQASYDSHPTDKSLPKALAGSKRLVPFVNKIIIAAKNMLIPFLNPSSTEFTPSFYAVLGGVEQGDSANSANIFDGDLATYASYTTIQKAGDYFGVDLGRAVAVNSIDILQAQNDTHHDYFHNAVLEYSKDAEHWETIAEYTEHDEPRHITAEGLAIEARFIRVRLTKTGTASKNDYWTYIREITINGGNQKTEDYGLYASEGIAGTVTAENLVYRLAHEGSITLPSGGYTGIKLKELSGLKTITADISGAAGLTVQYSMNGLVWETAPSNPDGRPARYVRLYNGTGSNAVFTISDFSVSVYGNAVNPFVSEYSAEYSTLNTAQGSGPWASLFDGDTSTFIWTNTAQRTGHYIIVDFGSETPVYDLDIIQQTGNPKFYNAQFFLSTDKENWGSPIMSVAEVNGVVTGEHRTESGGFIHIGRDDLGGRTARYLKIQITKDSGYFLRINEIEINKSVDTSEKPISKIFTNIETGNPEHIIDGDISTVFTAEAASDGSAYIKYPLTEQNRLSFVAFLQDASDITGAEVKAEIYKGGVVTEKILGQLDQGIKMFNMQEEGEVLSFTVTWPSGKIPALYEIIPVAYMPGWEQKVMSVSVTPGTVELKAGETARLSCKVLPYLASNKTVIWRSENPGVAAVDQNGAVTASAKGETLITATAADGSGAFGSCKVIVTGSAGAVVPVKVSAVTITPGQLTLKAGSIQALTASVAPQEAFDKTLLWSSSNESAARVDANGLVTAIAPGTAVIMAMAADGSGKHGTCTVTVTPLGTPEGIQKGKVYEAGNYRYKVTDLEKKAVELIGVKNAKLTKAAVPDTVTLGGIKFKIVSIGVSAFKNHKKITAATLGKHIESIGKQAFSGCVKLNKVTVKSSKLKQIGSKAFYNCGKLKTVTIKSMSLKTVGKNALKGIHKNAKVKVPAKKLKNYKGLFAKKGQAKTVKVVK